MNCCDYNCDQGRNCPVRQTKGKHMTEENTYTFIKQPEFSEWSCYMFGNRPGSVGIVYRPQKGKEPNRFVRWMMLVCFDSLWVKDVK